MHARSLLALNDAALRDIHGATRPLLVDVIGEGLTAARVVDAARQTAPQVEFTVRYGGGFGAALPQLLTGRLDVAFGRTEGLGRPSPPSSSPLVRYEPLALLLLADDPLPPSTPSLWSGSGPWSTRARNDDAPECRSRSPCSRSSAPGRRTAPARDRPGRDRPPPPSHGLPILTMSECPAVEGAVVRPLVEPVPVYPWAIVHRRDARPPELAALDAVIGDLARRESWLTLPEGAWLPAADARWTSA